MVSQASRLADVRYDIRGPVLARARELEAQGHEIIKLNIGNPAPFGMFTPDAVLSSVTASVADSQGYSDARGIAPAREAVARYFGARLSVAGVTPVTPSLAPKYLATASRAGAMPRASLYPWESAMEAVTRASTASGVNNPNGAGLPMFSLMISCPCASSSRARLSTGPRMS